MKRLLLAILILITLPTYAQFATPRAVVQEQLDAYNTGDIDRFMAVFSSDIQLFQIGEPTPVAEGEKVVREIYANLFEKSPHLKSEVINRTIIGTKVIDYERITGRNGNETPLYLVMIYEVENGKIVRAHSVRQ